MLPNQTLNAILSSLRTFDPLSDTLDILIISFVFYQLLQFARKSRAGQLVKGILLILVFYGLAVMLDLKTVTWVLNNVITIGFMAAVVIFQPELRRALERMGQSTMWANLMMGTRRNDPTLRAAWQSAVVAICDAAEQLSDTRTGALMVLERNNNLDEIIRTGTPMHADVIFFSAATWNIFLRRRRPLSQTRNSLLSTRTVWGFRHTLPSTRTRHTYLSRIS